MSGDWNLYYSEYSEKKPNPISYENKEENELNLRIYDLWQFILTITLIEFKKNEVDFFGDYLKD